MYVSLELLALCFAFPGIWFRFGIRVCFFQFQNVIGFYVASIQEIEYTLVMEGMRDSSRPVVNKRWYGAGGEARALFYYRYISIVQVQIAASNDTMNTTEVLTRYGKWTGISRLCTMPAGGSRDRGDWLYYKSRHHKRKFQCRVAVGVHREVRLQENMPSLQVIWCILIPPHASKRE